jgi:5-methylcytosine-specific restriction endonuclease McrA
VPLSQEAALSKSAKVSAARSGTWEAHGETVRQMVSDNQSLADICEVTGLNPTTIYNWVNREGWAYSPSREKKSTKRSRALADVLRVADESFSLGTLDIEAIAAQCSVSGQTVRRILKEHRSAEVEALRAPKELTEKWCSGCEQTLPISAFPERPDRIGKLFSLCQACRVDWARVYRHDNPVPIREASRRRRARLRGSRTDGHSEDAVYERDKGKCWFCGEQIDRSLKHPDPMSLTINHIHPIAKGGPDIAKNVAPAHLMCNRVAKDNYSPSFASWAVAPIPSSDARALVIEHHYLHRASTVSFSYGLYDDSGAVRGVISFGSPSSNRIVTSVSDVPGTVIELNRLWIDDDAPFGVGSWFVSRALRQLPPFIVVAYCDLEAVDPRYGSPHDGGIYRACSFSYAGTSRPNVEWRIPGLTRNVGKHYPGAVQVPVSPKRRFWTVTGSKTEKRRLLAASKWGSFPYIKDVVNEQEPIDA